MTGLDQGGPWSQGHGRGLPGGLEDLRWLYSVMTIADLYSCRVLDRLSGLWIIQFVD